MQRAKKYLALLLALAVLALSGCGYFETKMARAIQKLSKLDSVRVDAVVDLQAELTAGEQSLPLEGSITLEVDAELDPLLAQVELELALPGLSPERLHCYIVKEENATGLYLRRNDGTLWEKTAMLDRETNIRTDVLKFFVDGFSTFELAEEETPSVAGATRYDGQITRDFLQAMLDLFTLPALLDEEMGLKLPEDLYDGLTDVPTSLWLDESGRIVRAELTLSALLQGLSEPLIRDFRERAGLDALTLDLRLTGGDCTVILSQFDNVEELSIPEEAQAAWGHVKQPWEV